MTAPWAGRPTASLFGQLLALIGLSLVAAQAISLFLLFNRDRMRMGDLIAGTWVVMAQRVKLDADIATSSAGEAMSCARAVSGCRYNTLRAAIWRSQAFCDPQA